MKRKRKHIPLIELLASALADKLAQDQRDDLRSRKVQAREIVRLFTPDHIKLHAFGGEDRWWNLDMRLRGAELKTKDISDTKRAAKAVRIDSKWRSFMRAVAKGRKPRKRKSRWSRKCPTKRR